jgi:HTH-type transcriptional regulator / antitoxin HigA
VTVAPIRTKQAYQSSLALAAELIGRTDQQSLDKLELLQVLIERWERNLQTMPMPSPVEAIRFRMVQAGLKPRDLEPYIGSRARVSEVLSGRRSLSLEMIRALNRHLGIPADALIGSSFGDLATKRPEPSRAAMDRLRSIGILRANETFASLLERAFGSNRSEMMLRKTRTERTNAKTDLPAVEAWCAAIMLNANTVRLPVIRKPSGEETARKIAHLSARESGPALVRDALAQIGIVLVVLKHLPGTFLDGAAMCRTDGTPVIALTLRHDRIDNFWFTLLHEFCHVSRHLKGGTTLILDDLDIGSTDEIEEEADKFAEDALIPVGLRDQIGSDWLSTNDVIEIAMKAGVSPAIVAGRWQRQHGDYRRFAKMLGRGEVSKHLL